MSALAYPVTIRTIIVMVCEQDIGVRNWVTLGAVVRVTADMFLLFARTLSNIIRDVQ